MAKPALTKDPYQFHRAALAPLLCDAKSPEFEAACKAGVELGEQDFIDFIIQQGLAPLWDARLDNENSQRLFSTDTKSRLHEFRLHATGTYLVQRNSLKHIKSILDDADIDHVVTKGCHTREVYYATPALRPAQDIDILINPCDKVPAIKAFQARDFTYYGSIDNIAQDCSLIKGKTHIDLHWDILRPGRTRQPMVKTLLQSRIDYGSHWGMTHGATLFLMLVHPVFRKYSTTPHASLVRLMDLAYLLDQHPTSIEETRTLLQVAGLTTAGWITATWLHMLTGDANAKQLSETLRPGKLKQRYLYGWLLTNRSTTYLDKPLWIQLGFTLPAHDTWTDAIRALHQAWRSKRDADSTLASMQKQLL